MWLSDVVTATNSVWSDICSHLDGRISKNALHIFVHQDRHNIKQKLGISNETLRYSPTICETNNFDEPGLNCLLLLFQYF